jgi:hypothetical protein
MHWVVGNLCLTFEEMSTILTQVEACLNSSPLCQILSDPKDLKALTPGQFHIGGHIMALSDSDYSHFPMNKLSRWQLMQQCPNSFGENDPWIICTNYSNILLLLLLPKGPSAKALDVLQP